jgi:hypothetical protein
METPMQKELTKFIDDYGISGVLEILSHIADIKSTGCEDKALQKRYHKAMLHLFWLSGKKFMKGL